ncbi:MAG: hypothetical protein PF482_01915 [Desulfobacteraceae bacterium]|nr:hypothetical protein [Desulfobacteraceae bacterium]
MKSSADAHISGAFDKYFCKHFRDTQGAMDSYSKDQTDVSWLELLSA